MDERLRLASVKDVATLAELGWRTFHQTFARFHSEANMLRYLEHAFDPSRLRVELACPRSQYWLLDVDGASVGYLKLNWGDAQTDQYGPDGMEIERVYLLAELQGQGLGRALFDQARSVARSMGKRFLWLGVWEHNHSALGFYRAQGFAQVDTHPFQLGDVYETDLIMRCEL